MSDEATLEIVSRDGTCASTMVLVDGKPLAGVTKVRVEWAADTGQGVAYLEVTGVKGRVTFTEATHTWVTFPEPSW